jgi:hypothetical protein
MYNIGIQDNLLSMDHTTPLIGQYQWCGSYLDQEGQIQGGYGPRIKIPKAGNVVRFDLGDTKICNKSLANDIRRF